MVHSRLDDVPFAGAIPCLQVRPDFHQGDRSLITENQRAAAMSQPYSRTVTGTLFDQLA